MARVNKVGMSTFKGKIIENFVVDVHGVKVKCKTRMRLGNDYTKTTFAITADEFLFEVRGEDLDELRKGLVAKISPHIELTWSKHLRVTVSHSDVKTADDEADVRIDYDAFEVCTRGDGSQQHRFTSGRRNDTLHNGLPDSGGDGSWRGHEYAVLMDDTPEARKTIENARVAIQQLGSGSWPAWRVGSVWRR